jgi:1-deoxy-D-xylulose-5-phosphate synthase
MSDKKKNQFSHIEGELLDTICNPYDVSKFSLEEMEQLAGELRCRIIETVSKNGGHLAPNLGAVELTLALLHCFDPAHDRIVWDVGHQAYSYKILTGRRELFHTLRKLGGVSGFPRRSESSYDHFGVGHSSTSISAALGMAVARDLAGGDNNVVAVIGDGSMTAGQAYEGLNQAGGMGRKMVVVLNDNEMSISKNVGALSSFLSRKLSNPSLTRFKKETELLLKQIPLIGGDLARYARRSEESFKSFFTPGMLFEAFRFTYLGPIDGHNLEVLTDVFEQVKQLDCPVLVHTLTKKGKGYEPAETNPTYFHGVGTFTPETGRAQKIKDRNLPSYTEVFGKALCRLAHNDESIVAITAAMPEGTGTDCFRETYPDRFVDVGICEQHAVTFAAGLASQGFKPAVAIYSTFLQRSYDQVVHDVCLQNLNVNFFLDRGGLVGEDGATHHGVFDLAFLRHIPNMALMAPKDEGELVPMMRTAFEYEGPAALRYPRGVGVGAEIVYDGPPIELGKAELLRDGSDVCILALGSRVHPALEGAEELEEDGVSVAVLNTRFVKPLPKQDILDLVSRHRLVLTVEEGCLAGGFGSAVVEFLSDEGMLDGRRVRRLGIQDEFVEHGAQRELRARVGIDKTGVKNAVLALLGRPEPG